MGNIIDNSSIHDNEKSESVEKSVKNEDDEQYKLYTEKVVVKPSVKYRKFIMLMWVVAAGCIFGTAASVVFVLFAPQVYDSFVVSKEERETLQFDKDEYPQEIESSYVDVLEEHESVTIGQLSDNLTEEATDDSVITTDDYIAFSKALKKIASSVQKSIVSIDIYEKDMDDFIRQKSSPTETMGVVIGTAGSEYIILTNYNSVKDSDSVVVRFEEKTEVKAQIIGKDKESGIALLSIKESSIPSSEKDNLLSAKLGNSYKVCEGDIAIVAGKINGILGAIDFDTIMNISIQSALDNSFQVMDIGLRCKEDDFSFVFNTNGNLIGIAFYSDESESMKVTGISDVKSIIQSLSSGKGIVYMGISGQNVTSALATRYGLPMGIYIKDVWLNSPAYNAGIQSGDVIVGIDDQMVLTIQAFSEKLYQCSNDQQIIIKVKRLGKDGYKEVEFPVTVSVR